MSGPEREKRRVRNWEGLIVPVRNFRFIVI